jgi:hypothetical protein
MIEGMDDAARAVRREADEALDWLTPEGEKNLLGPEVVIAFGGLLVMGFLAGFQEEALKAAKKLGKKTGKATFGWLLDKLSGPDVGKAGKKHAPPKEVEESAEEAAKTAATLSDAEFDLAVARAREQLEGLLKERKLPHDRAARTAKAVSEASVRHVLKRKRRS